jgi:hypothetical protein
MFLIANSQCLEEIFVLKMWLLQFSKLGWSLKHTIHIKPQSD